MKRKIRIVLVGGLLFICVVSFALATITYCQAFCRGLCGCEGTPEQVWPDDPCCFMCWYQGMAINCCDPSWPGAPDGCTIWH
jgi:hypothetical protein